MHGVTPARFQFALGVEYILGSGAGLVLARLHFLAKLTCLPGGGLEKAALLRALLSNAGQLRARLLQLGGRSGNARSSSLTRSVLLRSRAVARSSSTAASFGATLRFLAFAIQLVATLGK